MNTIDLKEILWKLEYFEKLITCAEELLTQMNNTCKGKNNKIVGVKQPCAEEILLSYMIKCMHNYYKKFELLVQAYRTQGCILDKQLEDRIKNIDLKCLRFKYLSGHISSGKADKRQDREQQAFKVMIEQTFNAYSKAVETVCTLLSKSDVIRHDMDKAIQNMDNQRDNTNCWIQQYKNWMNINKKEDITCIEKRQQETDLQAKEARTKYQQLSISGHHCSEHIYNIETKQQSNREARQSISHAPRRLTPISASVPEDKHKAQHTLTPVLDGIYIFKEKNNMLIWFYKQNTKNM